MLNFNGQIYILFIFFVMMLSVLSFFRVILVLWKYKDIKKEKAFLDVFIYGLRFDIISLSIIILIPYIFLFPLTLFIKNIEYLTFFIQLYLTVFSSMILFMEISTFPFIEEYGLRPNRLYIEYLLYPQEVFKTIWKEYKYLLLISLAFIFTQSYFTFNYTNAIMLHLYHFKFNILFYFFFLIVLFIGGRSSFRHRAANISTVIFSKNSTVNDIALNSIYTVCYALYRMKDEADSSKIYGTLPEKKLKDNLLKYMPLSKDNLTSQKYPTLHFHKAKKNIQKKKNLVIILEESFGATFVKSLGGLNLTPQLEKLKERGIWFENLYSTGTRTVRGIESVLSGFLPTPGRSVVKLGLSQNNFFTLGSFLKKNGYKTQFIYGGESHFDNMASFFRGNGFDEIIQQKDFKNPKFLGTWGVCDEDLFARANEEFKKNSETPFFSFLLTTSNHSPYEFPDNSIIYEGEKNTRDNSVRYADHSLGNFFKMAEKEDYFNDTIFLVVADHDLRVSGDFLVPMEKFKIPGLILGSGIIPEKIKTITSQIDLPVTLISLLGIEGIHPMIGRDILSKKWKNTSGRAIMQYGNNQMFYTNNKRVIFTPNNEPIIQEKTNDLWIKTKHKEILDEALTYAVLPSYLYKNKLYI